MMNGDRALTYPNAAFCSITTTSSAAASITGAAGEVGEDEAMRMAVATATSTIRLSLACHDAANVPLPSPYDFSLEASILKKEKERERDPHGNSLCKRVHDMAIKSTNSASSGNSTTVQSSSFTHLDDISASDSNDLHSSYSFSSQQLRQHQQRQSLQYSHGDNSNHNDDSSAVGSMAMSLPPEQRDVLYKMKSITSGNEGVCMALLDEHGYELQRAVDAYFSSM